MGGTLRRIQLTVIILRARHQTGGRRSSQRAQVISCQFRICSTFYAYMYVYSVGAYVYGETDNYQIQVAWCALCCMKHTQPCFFIFLPKLQYKTLWQSPPLIMVNTAQYSTVTMRTEQATLSYLDFLSHKSPAMLPIYRFTYKCSIILLRL